MTVFSHTAYDDHAEVHFRRHPPSGLSAIIAIHRPRAGVALGGTRLWLYASEAEAIRDALRLSRAMTYKCVMAGLPYGGAKAVILDDACGDPSVARLEAMGAFVDSLGGRFVTGEDLNIGPDDVAHMARRTRHLVGPESRGDRGGATARGVACGIVAAVRWRLGRDDLRGVRVAVQGLGKVGAPLVARLRAADAEVFVADPDAGRVAAMVRGHGAKAVSVDEILSLNADVFAPCAMGSVISAETIGRLGALIVAGSANNPLADETLAVELAARGILYAPDYVINAGGLIDGAQEIEGYDADKVAARVDAIATTLTEVFEIARREGVSTAAAADGIVRARLTAEADGAA